MPMGIPLENRDNIIPVAAEKGASRFQVPTDIKSQWDQSLYSKDYFYYSY